MRCPEGDARAMICLVQGLSGITLLSQDLVLEHSIWNGPNISVTTVLSILCFTYIILALMLLCNTTFGALSLLTSGENACGFKEVLFLFAGLLFLTELDAQHEEAWERNV